MLTVNADEHPVMRQFQKRGDEKRTPVIIAPELHEKWLSVDPFQATEQMTWAHMPDLRAEPAQVTGTRLMDALDGLNQRFGRETVKVSTQGAHKG